MRAIGKPFCVEADLDKKQLLAAGDWKRGVSSTRMDAHRKHRFEQRLAHDGTLADFDDLAVEV